MPRRGPVMNVTILDGGMGQELIRRSGRATGLWSTQALLENPGLVQDVHGDFFAAGADIATTDTYAILPDRLEKHNIGESLETLAKLACEIAVQARDMHGEGQIAGSVGPLGFSYQPHLAPPSNEAAEIYGRLARIHAPYIDFHIAETMASVDQVKGALMGLSVTGKPVWIAMTVDDSDGTKLRSGEPIKDIEPLLEEYAPAALLVNCSRPEAVSAALPELVDLGYPVGAYANGFTEIASSFNKIGATVDQLTSRTDLDPKTYADFAETWIDLGATMIGGCCEVGPAHIAELKRRFG